MNIAGVFTDRVVKAIGHSLTKGAYSFFFLLDKVIYSIIYYLYSIFFNISNTRLLTSDVVTDLKSRLYLILSVITMFLIIYALLQIIIDPDKGLKGEYSISKIMFNLVKSTILVLIVPVLFSFAYRVQRSVLEGNVIGRIIFGNDVKVADTAGYFTVPVFQGFMYVNDDYKEDQEVQQVYTTVVNYAVNHNSIKAFEVFLDEDFFSTDDKLPLNIYGNFKDDNSGGVEPVFEYSIPFSTIAGGFMVFVLLIYCFDVALRAVKLSFLEIIAPFPILIGIIPKQQKIFNSWVKATLKSFFELFLRIFVMCVVVYLCQKCHVVVESLSIDGSLAAVTTAFLVLGLFMFMRKAPKLLGDIFGFDSKAASLSLADRLRDSGVTALAGGLLGTASYRYSTISSIAHRQDLSKWQKAKQMVSRGNVVSGLIHGGRLGVQEGWHNGSLKGMGAASNYAVHQEAAMARGANGFTVRMEMLRDDFGFMSYYDRKKYQVQMERDSEKLMIDKTLRDGTEKLNKFKRETDSKYKFEDKIKAYDRALDSEKKMEDLSDAQTEKANSNTRVKIKRLHATVKTNKYDSASRSYGAEVEMSNPEIDAEIEKVKEDFNNGHITQTDYNTYMSYYEGQKKAPHKLEYEFVLANKSQINKEIEAVNSLLQSEVIDQDTARSLISYYEDDRRKKLSKQNLSDANLYSKYFIGRNLSESDSIFGNSYNDINADSEFDSIRKYAANESYEGYVAECRAKGEAIKKSKEDFRFETYNEMKRAFLSTIYDDKKLINLSNQADYNAHIAANGLDTKIDQGKINNLMMLSNAYKDYLKLATDDSVREFELDASGNIIGDRKLEIKDLESIIGEDIYKSKDTLEGAKINVRTKKDEMYSEGVTIDIPKQLQGRVGSVANYEELIRLLTILQEESKEIDDKYNKELDYIKFLEPSAQASENIRKYRSKFKKNGKN